MVPNKGDFHALDWMGNAKALVNRNSEILLLSNICRHRQFNLALAQISVRLPLLKILLSFQA